METKQQAIPSFACLVVHVIPRPSRYPLESSSLTTASTSFGCSSSASSFCSFSSTDVWGSCAGWNAAALSAAHSGCSSRGMTWPIPKMLTTSCGGVEGTRAMVRPFRSPYLSLSLWMGVAWLGQVEGGNGRRTCDKREDARTHWCARDRHMFQPIARDCFQDMQSPIGPLTGCVKEACCEWVGGCCYKGLGGQRGFAVLSEISCVAQKTNATPNSEQVGWLAASATKMLALSMCKPSCADSPTNCTHEQTKTRCNQKKHTKHNQP